MAPSVLQLAASEASAEEHPKEGFMNRGFAVLVVTATMMTLTTMFLLLRITSRAGVVKRMGWDDYLMILGWSIAFGLSFSICYATKKGLGRHDDNIPPEWFQPLKQLEYIFSVLYQPALMSTKTSILTFYIQLSESNQVFRWFTILTMVIVNVVGFALTMLSIFQCRPLTAALKMPIPRAATCIDILSLYLSSAPLNLITDLAMLFLPMPVLTGMHLPKKQKIILIVTFGFGIFATAIDVVRVAYLQRATATRLQEVHQDPDDANPHRYLDFHWYAALSYMWSCVEVDVGIMCGCVPAIKPLVSKFWPHLLHDVKRSSSVSSPHRQQASHVSSRPTHSLTREPEMGHDAEADKAVEETMGLTDFVNLPDMAVNPSVVRSGVTGNTGSHPDVAPSTTGAGSDTVYDFVDMRQRRCLVNLTVRQSLVPMATVSVLFFIWGFEHGLLDVLNRQFQLTVNMGERQFVALHSAYYSGYLLAPLTFGLAALKHWGFKACFIVGLSVYACGVLAFWPSAVLTSFPALIVSNFIVASGLATLEVAANPFVALCGPSAYAEVRLCLSQGIQAIGGVVSPILAEQILFNVSDGEPSLVHIQWAYLVLAIFTVLLAVVYYYVPLPKASSDDFETRQPARNLAYPDRTEMRLPLFNRCLRTNHVRVVTVTVILGVMSQFFYVGGQESIATSIPAYVPVVRPTSHLSGPDYQSVGHGVRCSSRFLAAGLAYFIRPRHLLLASYLGALIFSICAMNFQNVNAGVPSVSFLLMVQFWEGPIFALAYVLTIRGTGRRVKPTSALLTAAVTGAAAIRPITFAVAVHRDVVYSFCIIVMSFAVGSLFPLWLLLHPHAKKIVDPGTRRCNCAALRKPKDVERQNSKGREEDEDIGDRPQTEGPGTRESSCIGIERERVQEPAAREGHGMATARTSRGVTEIVDN